MPVGKWTSRAAPEGGMEVERLRLCYPGPCMIPSYAHEKARALVSSFRLQHVECSVRTAKVLRFHVRLCEWTVSEMCRCAVLSAAQPCPSQSGADEVLKAHPVHLEPTNLPQSLDTIDDGLFEDLLKCLTNPDLSRILQTSLENYLKLPQT